MSKIGNIKIKVTVDKVRLKAQVMQKLNVTDVCSICEFEEQKEYPDELIPVCKTCSNHDTWRIREKIIEEILRECITITSEETGDLRT